MTYSQEKEKNSQQKEKNAALNSNVCFNDEVIKAFSVVIIIVCNVFIKRGDLLRHDSLGLHL